MKTIPYKMATQVSVHPRIAAAGQLCEIFRQSNFKAYWVGGAVRDLMLHPDQAPKDVDIATDAPFDDICKLLPKTRAIGKAFGVGLTTVGEFSFEIATFRKEGEYTDRRHPSFVGPGTLSEDSERRDFTINALYFDPIEGVVLDLHDGLNDLKAARLRCVGDPQTRLHEDPLRILRLFRFAARFNFRIDELTLRAAIQLASELRFISKERILLEVAKLTPNSIGRFAELFSPLQTALLGSIPASEHTRASADPGIVIKEPTFPTALCPATLFAVICASNEGFSSRNWPQTFDEWPLSSEERAHIELFQRLGEGLFAIPRSDADSDWREFLENFRWLQRQSRITTEAAQWLSMSFVSQTAPNDIHQITNLLSGLNQMCLLQNSQCTVGDCIEDAVRNEAKPMRDKIQSHFSSSTEKNAVGWARLMIDCGILLRLMKLIPEDAPDFLRAESDKKIASLTATAMRWSESKINGRKKKSTSH